MDLGYPQSPHDMGLPQHPNYPNLGVGVDGVGVAKIFIFLYSNFSAVPKIYHHSVGWDPTRMEQLVEWRAEVCHCQEEEANLATDYQSGKSRRLVEIRLKVPKRYSAVLKQTQI